MPHLEVKIVDPLTGLVVVRSGAQPLTVERIREFCADRLAHYKIPRYVHEVDGSR
jgi:fatty-acyl-CoA synthase